MPSHTICVFCARELIKSQLKDEDIFIGDALNPHASVGFHCPICREYCYNGFFKLLPPEIYHMYSTGDVLLCPVCNEFTSTEIELMTRHCLCECKCNIVKCNWCNQAVNWHHLKDADLLNHVYNECKQVPCSYEDKFGGECEYAGSHKDALAHRKSHKVRYELIEKLSEQIEQWDLPHLMKFAALDFNILTDGPVTPETFNNYMAYHQS